MFGALGKAPGAARRLPQREPFAYSTIGSSEHLHISGKSWAGCSSVSSIPKWLYPSNQSVHVLNGHPRSSQSLSTSDLSKTALHSLWRQTINVGGKQKQSRRLLATRVSATGQGATSKPPSSEGIIYVTMNSVVFPASYISTYIRIFGPHSSVSVVFDMSL